MGTQLHLWRQKPGPYRQRKSFAGMTIFAGLYHCRNSLHKHKSILMLFLTCIIKMGLSTQSRMPLNIRDLGVGFFKFQRGSGIDPFLILIYCIFAFH